MKAKGLTLIELVDILDRHGFKSLFELQKMPPNPMLWNKKHWRFVLDIIGSGYGISSEDAKQKFRKAGDILRAFNDVLRKTGLVIELQQVTRLSERKYGKRLDRQKRWDVTWGEP